MNKLLGKPKKVYVSRKIEFNAAHRLFNPNLTEKENYEIYGQCSNKNGHGHNYLLEISLCGIIDSDTGFLFDLKKLNTILEEEIISRFDHKHLNHDVLELREYVPTTEVLAIVVWNILERRLNSINRNKQEISLHEVKIYETGKNAVRYLGE
ncbi:MAG: 6-carboxytetrahydropterin synthase [Chlorobiaceae bacterium]